MAGGGGIQDQDDAINGINDTPLVDNMLVLLIIFMVTAKLIVSSSNVPLDLPKVTSGRSDIQVVFSIVLAANGSTMVDSRPVADDEAILALAKAALAKTPDLRAVIKAENAVPHGRVLHVLDLLKQAQISKIAFGVSPAPSVTPAPSSAPATRP